MYVEHRINGGWYKMNSITYFRLRRDLKDSNSKISKEISATLKKVLYLLLSWKRMVTKQRISDELYALGISRRQNRSCSIFV